MGNRKKMDIVSPPYYALKLMKLYSLLSCYFLKVHKPRGLLCSSNKCMTIDLCNSYLLHVLLHTKTEKYFPKKGLALANNIVKC